MFLAYLVFQIALRSKVDLTSVSGYLVVYLKSTYKSFPSLFQEIVESCVFTRDFYLRIFNFLMRVLVDQSRTATQLSLSSRLRGLRCRFQNSGCRSNFRPVRVVAKGDIRILGALGWQPRVIFVLGYGLQYTTVRTGNLQKQSKNKLSQERMNAQIICGFMNEDSGLAKCFKTIKNNFKFQVQKIFYLLTVYPIPIEIMLKCDFQAFVYGNMRSKKNPF